jgi:hypothetical protein
VKVGKVAVSPARYTGACPATTAFTAKVAVRGATTVTYRWLRGDGTKGPAVTARVTGGAVVVRDKRTFAASTSGWQALQVLSPRGTTSAKARFRVSCEEAPTGPVSVPGPVEQAAPRVTATVDAPPPYSGACPAPGHTVSFHGRIKVSRTPAVVAYRWVDSDGGPEPVERLWFAAGGPASKAVGSQRSFLTSQSGHRRLEIVDARGRVSHRSGTAAYRVTCSGTDDFPTPVASATNARVTPARYEGPCGGAAVEFVFRADLAVTKPAKVAYQWVRSDGTKVPGEVELTKDLSTVVTNVWRVADPAKLAEGSARLEVLVPNAVTTKPAAFTIACRSDVVSITKTELRRADNPNPCPGNPARFTVFSQVTPTASAKLPLTVSYQWRWADGSRSVPLTHTFDKAATVQLFRHWEEQLSKIGKVWLEVTVDGKATSGEAVGYEVTCGGKPPTDSAPRVVSINASITPSDYRGACPVKLKARAEVKASAPMEYAAVMQWMLNGRNEAVVDYAHFPAGGSLTKVVEREFTVNASTDGTATRHLEAIVPNVMGSNPVKYTVTCT